MKVYLTDVGRELQSSIQSALDFEYTSAAFSSDPASSLPHEMTALTNIRQQATSLAAEPSGEYAVVTISFMSASANTAYEGKTVGVYGRKVGNTVEVLMYVVDLESDSAPISPDNNSNHIFELCLAVSNGRLQIVGASYAPITHVSDSLRHIFVQTGVTSSGAVTVKGDLTAIVDGQPFIFVASQDMEFTNLFAGVSNIIPATAYDVGGNEIPFAIQAGKSYTLMMHRNPPVITLKSNELFKADSNGSILVYDSGGWRNLISPGTANIFCGLRSKIPPDAVLCDGSFYNAEEYPDGFDAIGYKYGRSGNRFAVPNLVGRKPRGVANDTDLGKSGGSDTNTLNTLHLPAHRHGVTVVISRAGNHSHPFYAAKVGMGGNNYSGGSDTVNNFSLITDTAGDHGHEATVTETTVGSGMAFNILDPYLGVYFIIYLGRRVK